MNRKHTFWLTLLLCLLLTGGALAEFGVIHRTDTLNLRAQGSSSSKWLGSYSRGVWVEILGSQNNFYRVRTPDGRTGYMSKNYIHAAPTSDDVQWTVYVSNQNGGAFLNFRSQPNYNSRVLGIFYNGVPLRVLGLSNGWYQVEINGQTGYVRSEFVTDWGYRNLGSATVATIKTPGNTAMNLRSGPGMNYGVIAQYPGDSYVSVLARGNDWWCVSIEGNAGFMSSSYLAEGLCAARDQASYPTETAYAVVNNPGAYQALNLRQYASTGAAVLDKLYNGDRLWVDRQGTQWCAVTDQSTGLSGYVMTRYIKLYGLPSSPTRRVYHPSGTYVNLRSSANMNLSNVLARVPSGSTVTVLTPGDEWCKVQYQGHTGYMLTYFLQ
ncbi:MAG: SH3 domain-containing protein [Candidatus Limiplasma sp.]|nr:SH3 domain-containing protein [Clostridiales bacterium]MDY3815767.1 SH3 domain-containing protein [Candidatus Limiplasma sp.]